MREFYRRPTSGGVSRVALLVVRSAAATRGAATPPTGVKIVESVGVNGTDYIESDATNFRGSDARIGYNPSLQTGCCDEKGGKDRPAFVGLAHELGHAKDAVQGTHPDRDLPAHRAAAPGTTPRDEAPALREENKVRAEHDIPIRPSYFPLEGMK